MNQILQIEGEGSRAGNNRAGRFAAALILGLVIFSASAAYSEPFIPRDEHQVLERLRATPFDAELRELRELRGRLNASPKNLVLATQLARICIERSRSEADPRYLGRAEAALSPWWTELHPPVDVLVLRATIEQSRHDFTNALADLELVNRLAPGNGQAWLTRATVLAVLGRYAEARRVCIPLVGTAPELMAICAAANVASLTGDGAHSCELLEQALKRNPAASAPEKLWALDLLAETSVRIGRINEARSCFERALALGRRDVYLLGAYADFLLEQGEAAKCAALLRDETRADGLLLRLALAESTLVPRPGAFEAHVAALRARFEASRLRGERVHQREEARFVLHILHEPNEALRLAQANWQVQHEPADLQILLETALVANQYNVAAPALEFLRRNKLEDIKCSRLVAGLQRKAGIMNPRISPIVANEGRAGLEDANR